MNKRFAHLRLGAARARQVLSDKSLAVGAALTVPLMAFAQADPFTAAATEAKDKVTTYGAELVAVAAVGVVFMIAIKYVKKIRGAA